MMKKILLTFIFLPFVMLTYAQILQPIKWTFASKKINTNEAVLFIKAEIEDGWHLYSQYVQNGGPQKTRFNFLPSNDYSLNGKTIEPKPKTDYEPVFGMRVSYFENQVIFQQKIKLKKGVTSVKGTIEYMTCNDEKCIPDENSFAITVR